jgi:hypothetical protein
MPGSRLERPGSRHPDAGFCQALRRRCLAEGDEYKDAVPAFVVILGEGQRCPE